MGSLSDGENMFWVRIGRISEAGRKVYSVCHMLSLFPGFIAVVSPVCDGVSQSPSTLLFMEDFADFGSWLISLLDLSWGLCFSFRLTNNGHFEVGECQDL